MELKTQTNGEHRAAARLTAIQLGDPSITLVENGPALGLLIAESCHQDSYSERLYLDRVTWARRDESVRAMRDFPEACLCRTEQGVWTAEETATGRLFPQPSHRSFHVVFVDHGDYRALMDRRSVGDIQSLFNIATMRLRALPGLHLYEGHLATPLKSAAAMGALVASRGYVPDHE